MNRAEHLMHQAADTAFHYLLRAEKDIDDHFGPGYAKAHPELMAAYMQTAAADFSATFGLQSIAENLAEIGGGIK